jgi:hypothetical protein
MTVQDPFMKPLLLANLLLVVLGIASLIVPIPHSETQGIEAGDINFGVQPVTVNACRRSLVRC